MSETKEYLNRQQKEADFRNRVERLLTLEDEDLKSWSAGSWKDGWLWTIIRQSYDCGCDLSELVDKLQEIESLCKRAKECLMLKQSYFNDVRSDEPFEREFNRVTNVTRKE